MSEGENEEGVRDEEPGPAHVSLKSSDVPQANSLDRIRQFVEAVRGGSTQKKQIQAVTGLSSRHADYYGQAARALGWVDRQGESYSLRHAASEMLETKAGSDEEREAFATSIERCEAVQALAPDLLDDAGPSEEELTLRITEATDLAQKTARRRAQALLTWRARVVTPPGEDEHQDLVPLLIDDDGEEGDQAAAGTALHARVDALRVERFKGVREAELELSGLTLFVGSHGVGKSSMRDLFRFLHALGRAYSLPEIAGERWGEAGTLEWSGIRGGPRELPYLGSDTFALSVSLAVPDGNQLRSAEYAIEIRVPDDGAPRVSRERLVVDGRGTFVFDSHPDVDPPLQVPDRLAVRLGRTSRTGARGPTLLVDPRRPALSQLALHPAVRTRSVTDAASLVLSAFRTLRFLDPRPDAMRRPSLPDQVLLGDHGENLSSVLHAVAAQREEREILLQSIRAFTDGLVHEIDFVPDATGRILLSVVDRHGVKLSAHSASEGVLRFLTFMAALLGPESPGFWFVDNLDAGFAPSKLGILLELLERHATATTRQIAATLRNDEALATVDLDPESITTAYRMFPYGWKPPERVGAPEPKPAAPAPKRPRKDDDDPNEVLPF